MKNRTQSDKEGLMGKWFAAGVAGLVSVVAVLCLADEVSVSATLRDSSVIKGELKTAVFNGDSAFMKGLSLPAGMVRELRFPDANGQATVTLANHDCFKLALDPAEAIEVESSIGLLKVPFAKLSALRLVAKGSSNVNEDLLFYCSFDSADKITRPEVGDGGVLRSGVIAPGKVGNCLKIAAREMGANGFKIPAGQIGLKGTIEFWGRIDDPERHLTDCGSPEFMELMASNRGGQFIVAWTANNGAGGSGLSGWVEHMNVNSGAIGKRTPQSILGNTVGDWHHYALVWDIDGIDRVKTAMGRTPQVALFVDGRHVSGDTFTWNNARWTPHCFQEVDGYLSFPFSEVGHNKAPCSVDEFKIWRVAKTEFEL